MAENRQRLRLTFAIEGDLRWLGHLDLFRTWERALRRAKLPLHYSQGFNPRPRVAIALPLPLGFTGEQELLDLLLDCPISPTEAMTRISAQLPLGLKLQEVQVVAPDVPSLQSQLEAAEYVAHLEDPPEDLALRVRQLLAAVSCPRQRRGQEYDLRPLILSLSWADRVLTITLSAGQAGTGRPDEVLLALGLPPQRAAIHRRRLRFAFDK